MAAFDRLGRETCRVYAAKAANRESVRRQRASKTCPKARERATYPLRRGPCGGAFAGGVGSRLPLVPKRCNDAPAHTDGRRRCGIPLLAATKDPGRSLVGRKINVPPSPGTCTLGRSGPTSWNRRAGHPDLGRQVPSKHLRARSPLPRELSKKTAGTDIASFSALPFSSSLDWDAQIHLLFAVSDAAESGISAKTAKRLDRAAGSAPMKSTWCRPGATATLAAITACIRRKADTGTKTNVGNHIGLVSRSGRIEEIRIVKLWRKQKGLQVSLVLPREADYHCFLGQALRHSVDECLGGP